jgi:hypothetical protein
MAWYKNKQRDVRSLTPEDEGYDPAIRQVAFKMDDGTEEIVDAALLGTGDLPEAPPPADGATRKASADKAAHDKAERDKAAAHK